MIYSLQIKEIKDLTPVRGQDGKISDTQGKDFWSPTRLCRVGDQQKSFPRVSEIFPSCPLTGVGFFFSLKTPNRFVYIPSSVFLQIFFPIAEVNIRFIHMHPCLGSIFNVFHIIKYNVFNKCIINVTTTEITCKKKYLNLVKGG